MCRLLFHVGITGLDTNLAERALFICNMVGNSELCTIQIDAIAFSDLYHNFPIATPTILWSEVMTGTENSQEMHCLSCAHKSMLNELLYHSEKI